MDPDRVTPARELLNDDEQLLLMDRRLPEAVRLIRERTGVGLAASLALAKLYCEQEGLMAWRACTACNGSGELLDWRETKTA